MRESELWGGDVAKWSKGFDRLGLVDEGWTEDDEDDN